MSIVPSITGIINPEHKGKPTEGVGVVFSRLHVRERNEVTIHTPEEYAEILYDRGNPVAHLKVNWQGWRNDVKAGVVKNKRRERNGLEQTYTARRSEYFISSGVIWLDYDNGLPAFEGNPAAAWEALLSWLLSKPLFRDYAAVIVPSSGFRPDKPKFHAAFWLDVPVFSIKEFTALWGALDAMAEEQLGVASDGAMKQPIQPIFGTRFTAIDDTWRTQIKPHTHNVVTPIERLRSLPAAEIVEAVKHPERVRAKREAVERSEAVARKGGKTAKREAEAVLKFILDSEYPERTLSMGEFIGMVWAAQSVLGADRVDEMISRHLAYETSSKLEALDHLLDEDEHAHTLDYLYYLATQRGYGKTSPMDVTPTRIINSRYVGQALTGELPRRALVKSYTGSGKTTLLRSLLATTQRQVLVIAPLKNLVEDIAAALRREGFEAVSYLAEGSNDEIRPTAEMRKAKVLCVTPQSAARLLDETHTIEKYGLVWIEEIDQIIRAAIQPGTDRSALYKPYHSDGFLSLVAGALRSGASVWGVDAGLTKVTVEWFKSVNTDVEVIVNTFQPTKAPLVVYPTAESVLKEGIKAAVAGKQVHFVTDTKDGETGTNAIIRLLAQHGVTDSVKLIDRDQQGNAAFTANANEALQTIQVLVTSPTWKSGVNITDWKPDLVVVVYTFLTPRDALQAANRTRQQGKVIAYFGMPRRIEPVMTESEVQARLDARYKAMLDVVQGVGVERTENAALMSYLSGLVDIDEQAQLQVPARFAVGLFEGEGRSVTWADNLDGLSKVDNQVRKDDPMLEAVRSGWPSVQPINRDNPPKHDQSVLEVRQGVMHSTINGLTLHGYDLQRDTPELVYDVVHDGIRADVLERATGLKDAGTLMLEQLHNPKIALEMIELDRAEEQAFGCLADFVIEGELSAETLLEHGERLIRMVERVRGAYDLCVGSRQRFDVVYNPNDLTTTARQLASNILAIGGLRLRRGNKRRLENPQTGKRLHDWYVENADYARRLLCWRATGRNNQLPERERKDVPLIALVFKQAASQIEAEAYAKSLEVFAGLSETAQIQVIASVQEGISLPEAIDSILHPVYAF